MSRSNNLLVPGADSKIDKMKNEIAAEFGLMNYDKMDKGNLTAKQNGQIGGEITKRLVKRGQETL